MPTEVILPKVDMDMETGTISAWHVAEGETVGKGDALFDIETDKAAMEIESPASGVLHHISAAIDDQVPIGHTVAWIYAEGEEVTEAPPHEASLRSKSAASQPPQKIAPAPVAPKVGTTPSDAQRATPAARKLAHDAGLSLTEVAGSGPRDRIQKTDVLAALETRAPAAPMLRTTGTVPLNVVHSGTGTGTPWLMIHGLGSDASSWASIEKPLAATAPVFRVELPCHGKSPRQKVDSFADLATQIRGTFDSLGLEKVRLIGHSLGGALSLALADTRPRNVENLTLISPAGLGPQINGDLLDRLGRASAVESLEPWLRMMVGDPDLMTDNYVKAAMIMRKDPKLRGAQAKMQQTLFPDHTQSFDLTSALHRLTCPTRIIFGQKDQVIPWSHALKAPGPVSLNLFPDLGHMPHFEDPESVLRLL